MTNINTVIETINNIVFKPCGITQTDVVPETESKEYGAYDFLLNGIPAKFRLAKITPTKTGQFVTIWKRNELGITEPFHVLDNFEYYIIATQKAKKFGLFIFPKTVLHEKKILSNKNREGKRGIRVYPIWDIATSKQAQQTQLWQSSYFLDLSPQIPLDLNLAKSLLAIP